MPSVNYLKNRIFVSCRALRGMEEGAPEIRQVVCVSKSRSGDEGCSALRNRPIGIGLQTV
ncbi:hypothetical protein [Pasteuria penetrans]|uniref:hypothetical protein n=1 Tax=Pasteuria penetrans TaxID=86005 RepID=UPI000FA15B47|nr:hypothetical protein [Pasteuria penetrans]